MGIYAPQSTDTLPAVRPPASCVKREFVTSMSYMAHPTHVSTTVAWIVSPEAGLRMLICDPHLGLAFELPPLAIYEDCRVSDCLVPTKPLRNGTERNRWALKVF